jgi:murein DD-endopeptidase MepM/ murein hydrolase activator NlpD
MKGFARAWSLTALYALLWTGAAGAQATAMADPRGNDAGGARAAAPSRWSAMMRRQDVRLGRVDADHDDAYVYRLPYGDEVSFPVIQSYESKLSHRGAERFTVDFGMPVGTTVHAARDGVVVLVEDSHDIGCALVECGQFANFVVLLHDDGTTGEYFHLERGSALVRPGERVERGQPLAQSGNTGFSTAPHLHFGVYRTTRDGSTESLAVQFAVRGGIAMPRSGARYLNMVR